MYNSNKCILNNGSNEILVFSESFCIYDQLLLLGMKFLVIASEYL